MPRFDKIGSCEKLDPERSYPIPKNPEITHVGIKNGKIAFFQSPESVNFYKSRNNWRFARIPEGAIALAFPGVKRTPDGWEYGIFSANEVDA